MNKPEAPTLEGLTTLGLNEREAKIYLALLRLTEATPAILHRLSGVPRTKVYETLEGMVSAGLCTERSEGRQRFYRATRPSDVGRLLKRMWKDEYARRRSAADTIFDDLERRFQHVQATDPVLDAIEVIRSSEQINERFLDLIAATERQVLSFTRSPYAAVDESTRSRVKQAQKEAFARGVVIRTVYMLEKQEWDWLDDFVAELHEAGEKVRFADHIPMKLFVFDGHTVLVTLAAVPGLTGSDFTMLLVRDPGFTESCEVLFEKYWQEAMTLDVIRDRVGVESTRTHETESP
jgi:sugar-specific transcriptional regulator TrmB